MPHTFWLRLVRVCAVGLTGSLCVVQAQAKDIRVPQDCTTLAQAVATAQPGDRVLVTNRGVFQESVRLTKDLTLASDPPGATLDHATTHALILASGASQVKVQGFTIQAAAGAGILVDVGHTEPASLELVDTKILGNGGVGVAFTNGKGLSLSADRCVFSGNKEGGIHSARPVAIALRECVVEKNDHPGLCVAVSEDSLSLPSRLVTCALSDCRMSQNAGPGVDLSGLATFDVAMTRCRVTGNKHGIWLDPQGEAGSRALLEDVLCADNREVGLGTQNPMELTLRRCQVLRNRFDGLRGALNEDKPAPPDRPGLLTLEDCRFTSNGFGGVQLEGFRNFNVAMDRCRLEGNSHGLVLSPERHFQAKAVVRDSVFDGNVHHGIDCNHPDDLELTSCTLNRNQGNGLFVRCNLPGKDGLEPAGTVALRGCTIQENAWSGIEHSGEANVAFTLARDRIERNTDGITINPRPSFGAQLSIDRCIIKDNLNHAIALGDRYALAFRDGAEWRGVLSDSCCAIFDGTPLGEANGKSGVTLGPGGAWFDYWTSPGNGKPAAPLTAIDAASLWPGFPSRPPLASLAGPALALRRCALMTNLLDQAEAWQSAGQSQKASGLLGLAQSIQRRFSPASPGGWALPLSARQRLDQVAAEVSQRQASVAAPYDVLMDRLACMPELPEVKLETPVAKLHDEVVQLKLNQLAGQLRECNAADLMANLIGGWHGFMTAYLAPPERLAAVQWLDGQLASAKDSTTSASLVFHKQWQAMYQELNSPAGEEKHLLWISGRCPKTGDAQQALERLTELYLDFWKAPEKAIQAQRQIQTAYAGSEREFQARLRIAKILEEQKNHEMAIVELSQLLEKLPPQLDPNPARTLLGLAYLGMNSTDEARNQFAKVINSDEGKNREKCLYLMAYSYIVDQRFPEAIKPLMDLKSLYPDGPYVKKADEYLAKFQSLRQ